MPNYSVDEKREIVEIVDTISKEMGLSASQRDVDNMATRLQPFYGPDLFRLLWQIPNGMKAFPSAEKIIARLRQGPVPPPKNSKPHDFKELVEGVFGKPEAKPESSEAAKNKAMQECLNAVIPKLMDPVPPAPRPAVEVPFAFELEEPDLKFDETVEEEFTFDT